jgi:hypothetical protein
MKLVSYLAISTKIMAFHFLPNIIELVAAKSLPLKILPNVRVYDHLRCQSDSVSRYTNATQRDNACNLMPSN